MSTARTDRSSITLHALRGAWLDLRGERVGVLPQRAIWLPARAALIVADLHVGKGEAYRALGVPMPEGLLDETLERLGRLVATSGATRVVVLGDLIHAPAGLTPAVRARVASFLSALPATVALVRGNHDRRIERLPAEWPIVAHDEPLDDPPFALVHHPAAHRDRYSIAGHLHPTMTLAGAGDAIRLPCFHFGPRIAVLPAFSRFSRGVPLSVEPGDRAFVVADEEVVEVPAGAA
ncbi:MAG: ligase-associated DNA damage response endonuclease PdeM [Phycisphaerales bacterium]